MCDSTAQGYMEVAVTIDRTLADLVSDFIIQHFSSGLVIEDEEHSPRLTIKFYVEPDQSDEAIEELESYLESLTEHMGGEPGEFELSSRAIQDREWEDAYRQSIVPLMVGSDIVVRPPWAEPVSGSAYDIIIEPKMAFGTGSHETTRSCLLAIRENFRGGRFLDLGCGSGILSILASRLGAGFITAIDYDPTATANCVENFEINGVTTPHAIETGTIELCHGHQPYDFVCANIIKSTIIEILDELFELAAPGGTVVLSGLLEDDQPDIERALGELKKSDWSVIDDNEWRTYVVRC